LIKALEQEANREAIGNGSPGTWCDGTSGQKKKHEWTNQVKKRRDPRMPGIPFVSEHDSDHSFLWHIHQSRHS
jgi:hypothetical protein